MIEPEQSKKKRPPLSPPVEEQAAEPAPAPAAQPEPVDVREALLYAIQTQLGVMHPGAAILNIWPAPAGLSVQLALSAGQVDTPMLFLRLSPEDRDAAVSAWSDL